MKKIALIGCGHVVFGKHREAYENLKDRIRPWVICDPSSSASRPMREWAEIPDERYVTRLEDLDHFQDEIDAAVVATPVNVHSTAVNYAMGLGWDVLCEKPLAKDLLEVDRMLKEAERLGRRLGVIHNIRYAGIVHDTCDYIQKGHIGEVKLVQGHAQSQPWTGKEWRSDASQGGAGHFFDCLYHEIYCARAVIQSPIRRVYGVCATLGAASISVEDVMLCIMEFGNGSLASFQDVKAFPETAPKLFASYGSKGAVIREIPSQDDRYVHHGEQRHPLPKHPESTTHGTTGVFKRFLNSMDTDTTLPYEIDAAGDGRENIRVVFAAYESARSGKPIDMRTWNMRKREEKF